MTKKFKVISCFIEETTEEILTYNELRNKIKIFSNVNDENLDRLEQMIIYLNDPGNITIEKIISLK